MHGGYIKLYRSLLEEAIWLDSNPHQKNILITLLLKVNYKEKDWVWQSKQFHLLPGQLITSLEKLAEASGKGITVQNVRSALKKFEYYGFLTNESTKTGRLITIVRWSTYQGYRDEDNKANNKDITNIQQTINRELTTTNKENKEKNDNKNIKVYEETCEKIKELFNSICTSLSMVQKITEKRKIALMKIWITNPNLNYFENLFKRVEASEYLSGRNKKWAHCSFDWIIDPNNMQKIIEGNYDNKEERNSIDDWRL